VLLGFNIENLQTVFGIPESVGGAGTLVNPTRGFISGQKMGTESLTCLRGVGIMADGLTNIMVDFNNVTVVPQVNSQLGGTNPAGLGLSWRCTSMGIRLWQ
jgi:hypothetical protein